MTTVKESPGKLNGVKVRSHLKVGTDICDSCCQGCKDMVTDVSNSLCQLLCRVQDVFANPKTDHFNLEKPTT
jgi:hypothetical protein